MCCEFLGKIFMLHTYQLQVYYNGVLLSIIAITCHFFRFCLFDLFPCFVSAISTCFRPFFVISPLFYPCPPPPPPKKKKVPCYLVSIPCHGPSKMKSSICMVTEFLNPGQIPVMAFDAPLFALAKFVQQNWPHAHGK